MSTPEHDDVVLALLRQQARLLMAELTGPLRRIQIRRGDAAVEIEWHGEQQPGDPVEASTTSSSAPAPTPAARDVPQSVEGTGQYSVVSPMVGTFYRAPEPGAPPFVAVGELVEPGRVIGIVEAMKLMNEITAGRPGRVLDVLVDDGQPVEFGQALVALGPP